MSTDTNTTGAQAAIADVPRRGHRRHRFATRRVPARPRCACAQARPRLRGLHRQRRHQLRRPRDARLLRVHPAPAGHRRDPGRAGRLPVQVGYRDRQAAEDEAARRAPRAGRYLREWLGRRGDAHLPRGRSRPLDARETVGDRRSASARSRLSRICRRCLGRLPGRGQGRAGNLVCRPSPSMRTRI